MSSTSSENNSTKTTTSNFYNNSSDPYSSSDIDEVEHHPNPDLEIQSTLDDQLPSTNDQNLDDTSFTTATNIYPIDFSVLFNEHLYISDNLKLFDYHKSTQNNPSKSDIFKYYIKNRVSKFKNNLYYFECFNDEFTPLPKEFVYLNGGIENTCTSSNTLKSEKLKSEISEQNIRILKLFCQERTLHGRAIELLQIYSTQMQSEEDEASCLVPCLRYAIKRRTSRKSIETIDNNVLTDRSNLKDIRKLTSRKRKKFDSLSVELQEIEVQVRQEQESTSCSSSTKENSKENKKTPKFKIKVNSKPKNTEYNYTIDPIKINEIQVPSLPKYFSNHLKCDRIYKDFKYFDMAYQRQIFRVKLACKNNHLLWENLMVLPECQKVGRDERLIPGVYYPRRNIQDYKDKSSNSLKKRINSRDSIPNLDLNLVDPKWSQHHSRDNIKKRMASINLRPLNLAAIGQFFADACGFDCDVNLFAESDQFDLDEDPGDISDISKEIPDILISTSFQLYFENLKINNINMLNASPNIGVLNDEYSKFYKNNFFKNLKLFLSFDHILNKLDLTSLPSIIESFNMACLKFYFYKDFIAELSTSDESLTENLLADCIYPSVLGNLFQNSKSEKNLENFPKYFGRKDDYFQFLKTIFPNDHLPEKMIKNIVCRLCNSKDKQTSQLLKNLTTTLFKQTGKTSIGQVKFSNIYPKRSEIDKDLLKLRNVEKHSKKELRICNNIVRLEKLTNYYTDPAGIKNSVANSSIHFSKVFGYEPFPMFDPKAQHQTDFDHFHFSPRREIYENLADMVRRRFYEKIFEKMDYYFLDPNANFTILFNVIVNSDLQNLFITDSKVLQDDQSQSPQHGSRSLLDSEKFKNFCQYLTQPSPDSTLESTGFINANEPCRHSAIQVQCLKFADEGFFKEAFDILDKEFRCKYYSREEKEIREGLSFINFDQSETDDAIAAADATATTTIVATDSRYQDSVQNSEAGTEASTKQNILLTNFKPTIKRSMHAWRLQHLIFAAAIKFVSYCYYNGGVNEYKLADSFMNQVESEWNDMKEPGLSGMGKKGNGNMKKNNNSLPSSSPSERHQSATCTGTGSSRASSRRSSISSTKSDDSLSSSTVGCLSKGWLNYGEKYALNTSVNYLPILLAKIKLVLVGGFFT